MSAKNGAGPNPDPETFDVETSSPDAPDVAALEASNPDAPDVAALDKIPLTDSGNGERLALQHRHELRYCHPEKTFYYYHPTKHYWLRDRAGFANRCAKGIARTLYRMAAAELMAAGTPGASGDPAKRAKTAEATSAWARRSESAERRRAALACLQSEPGIPIQPEDFDRNPYLLNCLNGTLDLKTFKLHEHHPEDYITKRCPVAYDPTATSETWSRVVREAMGGNSQLEAFFQRSAGYSLLGEVLEEVLFLLHGPTKTSKSTVLESLRATYGDYAITAPADTFLAKRGGGSIPNDVAALAGRRMVVAVESDAGQHLAESLIKRMTGGDTISARFLHCEFFEFKPQFTIWIATNFLPKVSYSDDAIWTRIIRIPFLNQVPEGKRNPAIKKELCDPRISGAAILAWAVRGLEQYYEVGLQPPAQVVTATSEYRREQNILIDFIGECCTLDPDGRIPHNDLAIVFDAYNAMRHRPPVETREFKAALRDLGCRSVTIRVGEPAKRQTAKGWRGIRLKAEGDDIAEFPLEKPETTEGERCEPATV